jgi:hypothetical protein
MFMSLHLSLNFPRATSTLSSLCTNTGILLMSVLYRGCNIISVPSWKNALFGIDITREPALLLILRFFLKAHWGFCLYSLFSLAALTFFFLGALP